MSFSQFLRDVATTFREDRIEKDAKLFARVLPGQETLAQEEKTNRWLGATLTITTAAHAISIINRSSSGVPVNVVEFFPLLLTSLLSYRCLRYSSHIKMLLDQSKSI